MCIFIYPYRAAKSGKVTNQYRLDPQTHTAAAIFDTSATKLSCYSLLSGSLLRPQDVVQRQDAHQRTFRLFLEQ
jgi:hypothetical protein